MKPLVKTQQWTRATQTAVQKMPCKSVFLAAESLEVLHNEEKKEGGKILLVNICVDISQEV